MTQPVSPDDPAGHELLCLATSHLRTNAAAGLSAESRYHLLMAARAAEIAWRDRSLSAAREEAAKNIERATGGSHSIEMIRSGQRDGDAVLHGALVAMTAIATWSTRPDLLRADERDAVEELCDR